ncbi:GerAB/ArcD/ProY family transporter [Orenia marismortui]|uniref:Spore germination protein (Amino acid permease) n=1 Tax=Orenia marismortui TaxID=46469 RepID=A0A4R8GRE7_9FIRM|nr:GerAB/ArcD/ProY family transporter [Orenia marismortui]TDX48442.1 spore germination protein (amino acid permease) [Orenia marismortui]
MIERIGSIQVFFLNLSLILSTIILLIAREVVEVAGQVGWVSIIFSGLVIGFLQYFLLSFSFEFSERSIINDSKMIFGNFLGNMIIPYYILALFIILYFMMYEAIDFIGYVMPGGHNLRYWIAVALLADYLAYKGIETICRLCTLIMIVVVLSICIIFILNYTRLDFKELSPFIIDFKKIIKGSVFVSTWFIQPSFILLLFKPFFKNSKKIIQNSILANLFIQIIVVVLVIFTIAIFGIRLTSTLNFPFYNLSRLSILGLEVVIFINWIGGSVLKVGIYYFAIAKAISEWFGLKNYKILLIPISIMNTCLVLFGINTSLVRILFKINAAISLMYVYIPLMILFTFGYLLKNNFN